MKKIICCLILWYALGVVGSIQFFRHRIDVTLEEVMISGSLGGMMGPFAWFYLVTDHINFDKVIIHKKE